MTSPGSASYPDFFEDDGEAAIALMPAIDCRDSFQLDSENGFGALLRSYFVCRVDYVGGGTWRLVNLSFT